MRFRSSLMSSAMTNTARYPFTAATIASPIPVLPEVGSTMVMSGVSTPRRSASSIMLSAGRSLTDPPGLKLSSFTQSAAASVSSTLLRRTTGVRPTVARTLS